MSGALSDDAFDSIRTGIVSGRLAEGSLHSIYGLAASLGFSRTPVREAVLRLKDAGLVTIEPNRGVRIRSVSADDIASLFELRRMLEVPAASYAASFASSVQRDGLTVMLAAMRKSAHEKDEAHFAECDRELHRRIAQVLGNTRLIDRLDQLRMHIRTQGLTTVRETRGMVEIWSDHVPIVDAIAEGDSAQAAAQMEQHLATTASLLMSARARSQALGH